MYPPNYQKMPPNVRIVNPNPQQLTPTQYYLQIQSKSDQKSYILNDRLKEIKLWKNGSSVVCFSLLRQEL
jgi:hypothetical protein